MGIFSSKADSVAPHANGQGKWALVTGATSGIGTETARVLHERGYNVILAGRSESKLRDTKQKLERVKAKSNSLSGEYHTVLIDTSSLASVKQCVETLHSQQLTNKLHLLINNAGVMMTPYGKSKDGVETQMATNHLGHFYLTKLLLPELKAAAAEAGNGARVVNVSSAGHNLAAKDFDASHLHSYFHENKDHYSSTKQYGNSKLANILFARGITEHYKKDGIVGLSVHPGVVATNLGNSHKGAGFFYTLFGWAMKTSNQGAATTVYCALEPGLERTADSLYYFADCKKGSPMSSKAKDPELAAALWSYSEQLVNELQNQRTPSSNL